jgi:hypothetical protein
VAHRYYSRQSWHPVLTLIRIRSILVSKVTHQVYFQI